MVNFSALLSFAITSKTKINSRSTKYYFNQFGCMLLAE